MTDRRRRVFRVGTGPSGARLASRIPRRVHFGIRHYGLDRVPVFDLGCAEGTHLIHFGPSSTGLELDERAVQHARKRGRDVRKWNFIEGIPQELEGGFDAVWCSNLLEHVLSPHEFLLGVRRALHRSGHLFVVVPMTRPVRWGPWRGFLAADHVSFFTRRTLRLTMERAGFRILYLGSSSFPELPMWLGRLASLVAPNVLAVAQKVDGFEYPAKAHKRLEAGRPVFQTR